MTSSISKNLNHIVDMYLDYAELQASRGRLMKMRDWAEKLDAFLQFNEQDILGDKGQVSHQVAIALAEMLIIILSRGSWQKNGECDRMSMAFRLSATIRRFPFAIATSALGTVAGIVLVDKPVLSAGWASLLGTALLALPLLVSARLLSERNGRDDFHPDKLTIAITAIGCGYCIFLSQVQGYAIWYRHSLWTIAAFLVVLLFPFYKPADEEEFWHFNASLVYAFAIAVISAFVLFSGISAALAGADYLLAVKIHGEAYLRLWIILAGFVAVVIFLSAVPADIRQISHRPSISLFLAKRTCGSCQPRSA